MKLDQRGRQRTDHEGSKRRNVPARTKSPERIQKHSDIMVEHIWALE